MRFARLATMAVLCTCSSERGRSVSTPIRANAPVARARQLVAETALRTRSGAGLQAPKDWWLTEDGDAILLEDPERTLKSWVVETREADALKAIALAWQRVAPGFALSIAGEPDTPPPEDGWDAITNVSYATRDRVVKASARRYNDVTYVTLIDGDPAAMSRRGPQLELAMATLRPEGMAEESFAGRTPRAIDADGAKELDAFIGEARARLGVPGAAVAVVKDGTVVYERAFGARALGAKALVTPRTLFMVGSITKPMTTMMQASLVDAKAIEWTTPVVSVLPSFALGDAELTRSVLLWHMSCACTGMPPNLEYIFEYDKVSPEQRIASMKSMKPTTKLGETFQYSNLMVAAGGYVAAHAYAPKAKLGDAYDTAMRARVFGPIGMTSTTLDFTVALRGDHAFPHARAIDGAIRILPIAMERNVISIRPAGGVWSNLRDMERYVMTELANGVAPGGKRVVSEENMRERRTRRVGDAASGYGLGLGVGTYYGVPTLGHDGGAFGFGTSMVMLPEQGIGIIVLTNVRNGAPTEHLPFNAVVTRRGIEAMFEGAKPLATAQLDYFVTTKARFVANSARVQFAGDAARLKKVAGTYTNASLGTVTLTPSADGLLFDVGEWKSLVRQKENGGAALVLVYVDPPFAGRELTIDDSDGKPSFTIPYEQTTYVFARRAR